MHGYHDEVMAHLVKLLTETPPSEQASEMAEAERWAWDSGYLNQSPRQQSLELFALDLLSDLSMAMLIERDKQRRNALGAETPTDLVLRLLPSDGHLD